MSLTNFFVELISSRIKAPGFLSRHVAVKDNIATEQYPTTCAAAILQRYRSPFEATAVTAIRRANDALVSGKTNMDEFGMGSHSTNSFFGRVQNDEAVTGISVGGSSGGSAAAVAFGQCNAALGTDTGGSVRLPAAYTGIVGFKPSYGLISRWGVVPYANSLDTVGIMGRSTAFVHSLLTFKMMSHDPRDPTSLSRRSRDRMARNRRSLAIQAGQHLPQAPIEEKAWHFYRNGFSDLNIGIPMEYNIAELDPVVREAWQSALDLFQKQGCNLVPVSLPSTKHALSAYYILAGAEAASNLSKYDGVRYGTRASSNDEAADVLYSNTRGEGLGDEVKRRILLGSYSLSSKAIDNYFIKAQKVRRLVQRDFDRVFSLPNLLRPPQQFDLSDMDEGLQLASKLGPQLVDFIVCPSAPTLPPSLDAVSKQSPVDSYINDIFTVPSSLAGLPAMSIPFKIPHQQTQSYRQEFAGVQLIGQYSDDNRLLLTARVVEMIQSASEGGMKKVVRKESVNPKPRIKHHISSKSGILREPRTPKEIDASIEDAFEDWDNQMFRGER